MSIKNAKKIGFYAALSMLIGSVVGIGIFFKNGSILKAGSGNGTTALLAWIVGGLLALFAAISFSELGTIKVKKVSGLSAWSEDVGGKKYGFFVRTTFTVFYWGFLTPVIGFFVAELLFSMLHSWDESIAIPKVWVNALVGLGLTIGTLLLNYLSLKVSGVIQQIVTIIKFIPLLLALFIGIIMFDTHNQGGSNHFNYGSISFTGLLAGLPAVLFSYDAFLTTAQLTNKVKGGTKTISKVVLIGLSSIIILYSLIAVSSMLHSGDVGGIIKDSLPKGASKGINIFVFTTLFFSGYGVLNGVSAAMIASQEQIVQSNGLFGTKRLKKIVGVNWTNIVYISLTLLLGFTVVIVPAIILDTDAYVDASSNFPSLFMFAIYATTILMYTLKRDKYNTKKINKHLYLISAWAFVIGSYFVVFYQLIYGFTIQGVVNGINNENVQGIGLFAPATYVITNLDFLIIFICFIVVFLAIPLINYLLIKFIEKRNPFTSTQTRSEITN